MPKTTKQHVPSCYCKTCEKFIRRDERERCAKVAHFFALDFKASQEALEHPGKMCNEIAKAIRSSRESGRESE